MFQKQNAYIFDFAPERTLTIFDAFANNLLPNPSGDPRVRQENIRRLLNFFPVLGEDAEGRMIELDASQVLTFPQVFKAREVVRRGFLSNLLFANVAGIFRYSEHVKEILDKLPTAKQGKVTNGQPIEIPQPPPVTDRGRERPGRRRDRHQPQGRRARKAGLELGRDDPTRRAASTPARTAATQIAKAVTEQAAPSARSSRRAYGLTAKQVERDEKRTEPGVKDQVERAYTEHNIASRHLEDEAKEAATEAEAEGRRGQAGRGRTRRSRRTSCAIVEETMDKIVPEVVTREETKKEQKRPTRRWTMPAPTCAASPARSRCSSWPTATADIRLVELRRLHARRRVRGDHRDHRSLSSASYAMARRSPRTNGAVTKIPGLFDEAVFDQAVQEFLDKKDELWPTTSTTALTENIFAYIPQQKTSLVFTPQPVVTMMVDTLEAENPGIFTDPTKTFADLFSTAGLFLMELVRRLDTGLADAFPDQDERLRHILTSQVFEMSHNEILHRITIEAVSGGVPERKAWIEDSGHFRVGNLARHDPGGTREDGRRHAAEGH